MTPLQRYQRKLAALVLCVGQLLLGARFGFCQVDSAGENSSTAISASPADAYPVGDSSRVRGGIWAGVEYLHWWIKANELPPLVTSSPLGTPQPAAGVLGPGTTVLFGGDGVDEGSRPGLRATIGHWFDPSESLGAEITWFSVFNPAANGDFFIRSDGNPIVARPFFEPNLQQDAAELTAFTDPSGTVIAAGSVGVRTTSELHSAALLLRARHREGRRGRVDLLGGYRFLRFREGIVIDEQVIARDPGGLVPVGTTFDLTDRFTTESHFHGGEIGVAAEFVHQFLSLQLLGKLAVGNVRQRSHISGVTVVTIPPPVNVTSTTDGGLLAQPTNIGMHTIDQFAVLPELGINATVLLTERCTLTTGYSLLQLNHVARSGDQIDLTVNSTQIGGNPLGGPARPQPTLADSHFWAQGLNVGLTVVY